jgi:hypothetical protein
MTGCDDRFLEAEHLREVDLEQSHVPGPAEAKGPHVEA